VPVVDERGDVEQLVMSSIDITDRLRYERELGESLERQRTISRRLQRTLLPESLPEIEGLRLGAVYRSAIDDLDVGGDWYDAFRIDDHRIALAIGDIVGRGIDAAGATGQLRSATRAIADTSTGPADVMARLDRFAAGIPAAVGATMIYLEIDQRTCEVSFCRAGHVPPLVCAADSDPVLHEEAGSPPLATVANLRRSVARVVLRPGSFLLLCTDGLIERRSDESIDVGLQRLADAATRHQTRLRSECSSELTAALESITDELTEQGRTTDDDLCILAVHHYGRVSQ
jgi:serine/threonine-protein kinase RsbW